MTIKAILIDIDGTLMFKAKAFAGAQQALSDLRDAGFSLRLLTNVSARLPGHIVTALRSNGFEVDEREVQTAATACARYVLSCAGLACHLMVPEAMQPLFEGVRIDDEQADLVVIGDIGEQFTYAGLNHAFRLLLAGARLVVPHKNLFWYDDAGPRLDAGAFVVGLEAASGQPALVTGKPSPVFFHTAMDDLGVSPDETLVVGDDIHTDIAGARNLGMRSVLVRTGKGALQRLAEHACPDHEIDSIADLIGLLGEIGALDGRSRPDGQQAVRHRYPTEHTLTTPAKEDGAA
jgi:HAD superfamily hydrolase (TIGR01458 family)